MFIEQVMELPIAPLGAQLSINRAFHLKGDLDLIAAGLQTFGSQDPNTLAERFSPSQQLPA
jgi:hypothetical protein